MRILVVNNQRGLVGGLETYLHGLFPALHASGHQVALLYKNEASDGAPGIDSGGGCEVVWRGDDLTPGIPDEVESWNPDVVYLNEPPSFPLHSALVDRFPVVMFAHGYFGACATGRKMHAFPQPIPCTRRCGPVCLVLHYPRRCGGLSPLTMVRSYRTQMANQTLLGKYRAIAVASEYMRVEYLRHRVAEDRLHVVPLPPSVVEADPRPPSRQGARNRVLFLGRLTDLKGVDYLLQAIGPAERELARPLSLTVAGAGAEESRLRALARQLQLNVNFTGWLDSAERMRRMRESDLLAAPSIWPEPFGLVGIEAGCTGLPAVAFDVGGITEWLQPGKSGEIAPGNPPTPRGLTDALVRALARPDHYQDLSRGAWEVARRFTLSTHLEKLLPILERAAQKTGALTRC